MTKIYTSPSLTLSKILHTSPPSSTLGKILLTSHPATPNNTLQPNQKASFYSVCSYYTELEATAE